MSRKQYRRKVWVVDAFQLPDPEDDKGIDRFHDWADEVGFIEWESGRYGEGIFFATNHGDVNLQPGGWIIKGADGEFYPCNNDLFEKSYEPFDDPFKEDS